MPAAENLEYRENLCTTVDVGLYDASIVLIKNHGSIRGWQVRNRNVLVEKRSSYAKTSASGPSSIEDIDLRPLGISVGHHSIFEPEKKGKRFEGMFKLRFEFAHSMQNLASSPF